MLRVDLVGHRGYFPIVRNTLMWAIPRAPPPPSARPMRGRVSPDTRVPQTFVVGAPAVACAHATPHGKPILLENDPHAAR